MTFSSVRASPNVHGPRDLGAFEIQEGDFDPIFASGFDPGAG
jgi:hypothetical protein